MLFLESAWSPKAVVVMVRRCGVYVGQGSSNNSVPRIARAWICVRGTLLQIEELGLNLALVLIGTSAGL